MFLTNIVSDYDRGYFREKINIGNDNIVLTLPLIKCGLKRLESKNKEASQARTYEFFSGEAIYTAA